MARITKHSAAQTRTSAKFGWVWVLGSRVNLECADNFRNSAKELYPLIFIRSYVIYLLMERQDHVRETGKLKKYKEDELTGKVLPQ